jgi:dihydropyrimidinase
MSPTWWSEDSAREIKQCIKEENINSFKVYLAYKSAIGINDDVLIRAMETIAKEKSLMTLHCEHGETIDFLRTKFISEGKTSPLYHPLSRPNATESEAVNRAITLAKITNCPIYIVHVSTAESIELIEKAQLAGQKVYAETCPQYLLLDDKVYNQAFEDSAKYVLSPPIRKKKDQSALWRAIKEKYIQTIGTDHCPFNLKGQKDVGKNDFTKIPNGAGGIEHRLSLLYTYGVLKNKITINQFVDITSTKAADIFKLKNKGKIKIGYDADLVIWNPKIKSIISTKTHHQNCDSNIFEGFKTVGIPEIVIINGKKHEI